MDERESSSNRGEQVDFGEVVGRDFADKLLLAIIDAHPGPEEPNREKADKNRRDRLRAAHQALFGTRYERGHPGYSDEAALRWMGAERYKEQARKGLEEFLGEPLPTKLRAEAMSARRLGAEAAERFGLPDRAEQRLRKTPAKQVADWMAVEEFHDDVPEQLDFNLLTEIRDTLAKRSIAMNLDRIER